MALRAGISAPTHRVATNGVHGGGQGLMAATVGHTAIGRTLAAKGGVRTAKRLGRRRPKKMELQGEASQLRQWVKDLEAQLEQQTQQSQAQSAQARQWAMQVEAAKTAVEGHLLESQQAVKDRPGVAEVPNIPYLELKILGEKPPPVFFLMLKGDMFLANIIYI